MNDYRADDLLKSALVTAKRKLRRTMEDARAAISPDSRRSLSLRVCERATELLSRLDWPYGSAIFSYVPFRTELDVSPVWKWCRDAGIQLAVPKVLRSEKRMQIVVIESEDDLVPGAWGIPEPKPGCAVLTELARIGAVLVPGLAFDPQLGRLGYGGGYYDRFFASFGEHDLPLPYRLAPAFDVQIVPSVPAEPHDTPMSAVVTEARLFVR